MAGSPGSEGQGSVTAAAPSGSSEAYPDLPLESWRETKETLHRFSQVVGKVRLASSYPRNHWWDVPLYVTARGVTTSPMHHGEQIFEIQLDYVAHELRVDSVAGRGLRRSLPGLSVADFYSEVTGALRALDIGVRIAQPRAYDLGEHEPFATDTAHRSYDPGAVNTYWRILATVDSILKEFAWRYTGKTSPVHHFWHNLDIAVSRFSGRIAPANPRADRVTREAYSHELVSFGFWFGDDMFPEPAFYSYTAPEPEDLAGQPLQPPQASWTKRGSGHLAVLPWAEVRAAPQPRAMALAFLESAWRAGTAASGPEHWAPARADSVDAR
jgi:hypothetical protein